MPFPATLIAISTHRIMTPSCALSYYALCVIV